MCIITKMSCYSMTYTSIIATESIVTNWIKDLERNFQQIDNEEEPGVNADVFHLLLAHRKQINRHYWSGSITNHCGETAEQTEEGRIPPFMHPSVFLAEYFAPNHYSHRQGERPTHQLAESLCRDELVNKKCYEKA